MWQACLFGGCGKKDRGLLAIVCLHVKHRAKGTSGACAKQHAKHQSSEESLCREAKAMSNHGYTAGGPAGCPWSDGGHRYDFVRPRPAAPSAMSWEKTTKLRRKKSSLRHTDFCRAGHHHIIPNSQLTTQPHYHHNHEGRILPPHHYRRCRHQHCRQLCRRPLGSCRSSLRRRWQKPPRDVNGWIRRIHPDRHRIR